MKIEKVSENQIKCILSREDLASRHLRISELAYGSDKARELFQDMMQQAQYELGFEAENLPLMIEAIPVSGECLILLVTKVEDPEELDTRFSKFAPSIHEDAEFTDDTLVDDLSHTGEEVLDLFKRIKDWLRLQDHSSSPAIRVIINRLMLIIRELPEIMSMVFRRTLLSRFLKDRRA